MDRRLFLASAAASMIVITSPLTFASSSNIWPDNKPPFLHSNKTVSIGLTRSQWKLVVAAQNHLFPKSRNAPGAIDVNAKAFLYAVLSDANRNEEDRILIKNGAQMLQRLCINHFKKGFDQISTGEKEMALRTFETMPDGTSWILTILGYIFEALLTDPVYGGNPNGIGWQWLEHQPGFPRPGINNRYFLYQS